MKLKKNTRKWVTIVVVTVIGITTTNILGYFGLPTEMGYFAVGLVVGSLWDL